jgi:hypothetical protein
MHRKKSNKYRPISRQRGEGPRMGRQSQRSAAANMYSGPSTGQEQNGQPFRTRISYGIACNPTASGNVATFSQAFDTSAVASTVRWASLKAIYAEWRPVALHVTFVPGFANAWVAPTASATVGNTQALAVNPMFLLPYVGAATTISSVANAADHQFQRTFGPVNQPLRASIKMDEADEASWVSCNGTTPGAVMGVKAYTALNTTGATDTVFLGNFIIDIVIQLRSPVATTLQEPEFSPFFKSGSASAEPDVAEEKEYVISTPTLARQLSVLAPPKRLTR